MRFSNGMFAGIILSTLLTACDTPQEASVPVPEQPAATGAATVDGARITNADSEPHNWLAHGRTYSEQRYSPLDQINKDNVAELGLAWTTETGTTRGLEASPIVVDGVMYTTVSWSAVMALDAKTGEVLWTYDPEVPRPWGRYACCDVINRGAAVWQGKVYVGTIDGRLVALNAEDGSKVWEVNTIDRSRPYTITQAPRVVKGKVIIGNGGGDLNTRGYVTAYDAETGEQAWRFFTVPGDPKLGFEHPEMEMAAKTWSPDSRWDVGLGGNAWDSMAYDPELNLLYIGTGNGNPWNKEIRSPGGGDNLFLVSILAVNPDTGRLVWHYQQVPAENWDYTATQHMILADLEWQGELRKVIMQAPKNGFFYVLDRTTGELLSAEPYVYVNWAKGIDLETGRPVLSEDGQYLDEVKHVFPSPYGGHNWQPMAYNPDTGYVYIPAIEASQVYPHKTDFVYRPGVWNTGLDWAEYARIAGDADLLASYYEKTPGGPLPTGKLIAWDVKAEKPAWSLQYPNIWNGGILTTAGGLVFQGRADARLLALDAKTGNAKWETSTGVGIVAPPITYEIDGEQYIAVMAGYGGAAGAAYSDPNSAVIDHLNTGRILVFKLGGTAELPETPKDERTIPVVDVPDATPEQLQRGFAIFHDTCSFCHGTLVIGGGMLPDLRHMDTDRHAVFMDIVRGGLLEDNGMASFADVISEEDALALQAYILKRAQEDRLAAATANTGD